MNTPDGERPAAESNRHLPLGEPSPDGGMSRPVWWPRAAD